MTNKKRFAMLKRMQNLDDKTSKKNRMPVLFIGHGSPMNAIEKNEFTETLARLGKKIKSPLVILCISAHWMTEGTWITHMAKPKTIHDFYGFPQPLFDVQYPAPGGVGWADRIIASLTSHHVQPDKEMWGLDHGTWSILRHMYPKADIPVLQLSLDMEKPSSFHYELGKALAPLRDQGVLIVGSGNVVHNLRKIEWETHAKPHDWAAECDQWIKNKLEKRDFISLVNDAQKTTAGKLSIPTFEHYFPFLYTIGASLENEALQFEFEDIHNASISMRSLSYGLI